MFADSCRNCCSLQFNQSLYSWIVSILLSLDNISQSCRHKGFNDVFLIQENHSTLPLIPCEGNCVLLFEGDFLANQLVSKEFPRFPSIGLITGRCHVSLRAGNSFTQFGSLDISQVYLFFRRRTPLWIPSDHETVS